MFTFCMAPYWFILQEQIVKEGTKLNSPQGIKMRKSPGSTPNLKIKFIT